MVHDSVGSGEDHESELTGREQVVDPLFNILDLDVEARADDLLAGRVEGEGRGREWRMVSARAIDSNDNDVHRTC